MPAGIHNANQAVGSHDDIEEGAGDGKAGSIFLRVSVADSSHLFARYLVVPDRALSRVRKVDGFARKRERGQHRSSAGNFPFCPLLLSGGENLHLILQADVERTGRIDGEAPRSVGT